MGEGEGKLSFPIAKELPEERLGFRRVGQTRERGSVYGEDPPQMANRLVDGARGVLNNFLPDVYIFTDHHNGKEAGTRWRMGYRGRGDDRRVRFRERL